MFQLLRFADVLNTVTFPRRGFPEAMPRASRNDVPASKHWRLPNDVHY